MKMCHWCKGIFKKEEMESCFCKKCSPPNINSNNKKEITIVSYDYSKTYEIIALVYFLSIIILYFLI